MGEIADYIFENIEKFVLERLEGRPEEEEILYMQDLDILKELIKNSSYKVIKDPYARVRYLLKLRRDF